MGHSSNAPQVREEESVIFLVADCVYDEDLTDDLFSKVKLFLGGGSTQSRRLMMTLEKRFNFTIETLSVVAHGYRYPTLKDAFVYCSRCLAC